MSDGSDDDQQAVVLSQTGKKLIMKPVRLMKVFHRRRMPKLFLKVVVPDTIPAVTSSTPSPTDTEPSLTTPAVVENEPADNATGNAPAEARGPDTVSQAAGNVETEDAPVASTPVVALPAGLTPAVLRQLLAAAEQLQNTQGAKNLTPQKRK